MARSSPTLQSLISSTDNFVSDLSQHKGNCKLDEKQPVQESGYERRKEKAFRGTKRSYDLTLQCSHLSSDTQACTVLESQEIIATPTQPGHVPYYVYAQ